MQRWSIILTAFLLLNQPVHPQSWRIDKLGVQDGLSQGYIYAIHQDRQGFMWIGTHGGLNRYDGYDFRVFQYIPFNSSSLGDNAVFFLKEDSVSGMFWIGGSSCLNKFDPRSFTNTRYYYSKKQVEFSDGFFINKNELLLACEYTVLLFDTRSGSFNEIPVVDENGKPMPVSRVENICADRNRNIMIMSRTGIFFYDHVSKTCKRRTSTSPNLSVFDDVEVFNVLQDSKNNYWIATNKKGLIRWSPENQTSTPITLPQGISMESLRFDVVMEDSRGFIWAGSSNGLFRIDPVSHSKEYFSDDPRDKAYLTHPEVNAIHEDNNHFLWIGTVGGGLNKLIPRSAGFRNFTLASNSAGGRTGTYIMALQQMGDDIWFTNIWDQVGKVNRATGRTTLLNKPLLPQNYSWYSEGSISRISEKEIAILNGENQYQVVQDKQEKIGIQTRPAPGLSHVFHDNNNKPWYMVKSAVDKLYVQHDTIYGNNFFYDAVADTAGNAWIGSSKGLIKFDTRKKIFTTYQHDDKNSNSVASDFIYSLEIDSNYQTIWMAAYNGGLCSYHIPSGRFRTYGKEDGMADNIVYAIEKDRHDNFWFSSNAGISNYNTSRKTFRNYSVADGLLNHEFNRRCSFKSDDGWLFFGGISGIDYFHPDSIVKTTTSGHLAFSSFRIFNNDVIPRNENGTPMIELNQNQRYVSIDFSSLDFNDQQKVQYAYRIDDNEWIKMGIQHSLSFSNLSPGSHRITIRSTNSDGTWLNNEIACMIIVHPPWWRTWWFLTLFFALLLGMLVAAIRFYYRRKLEKQKSILERQQAIEKERTRIATDMHDDLGAGLSRIKFLSETIAIKKLRQEPIETDISSIRDYSHEMIDKMGEIVWALNEKNDSLNDLLAYSRAFAVEYLTQHGIRCIVETTEDFPTAFVTGEFRRNVFLAIKEALHNVVKHSGASQVFLSFIVTSKLTITIRDNGKGYDAGQKLPYRNGLNNMRQRMKDLGGTFEINGGQGTTIDLVIPLPS